MRRHRFLLTLGVLVVLALPLIAYLQLRPRDVETVALETREVRRTLVVVGQVRPLSRADLGTSVSGVVREVLVAEGDRFERGDVLVRLDDREARASVAQADARLVEVEATVQDEVERATLEVEQALRELERLRAVYAQGGLTLQRVEQAEQRAADAASRLDALRAPGAASGSNPTVAGARSVAEAARARLALSVVTAPYDGRVLQRLVEPGAAVQAGRGLLAVAADGPTEVVAFPLEENLARLRVGAPAVVSADAYPDDVFPATVAFVAPSVDAAQGTVEVRLSIDAPPAYLLPGMTLSVNIEVDRKIDALVLPTDAVRGLGTDDPWVAVIREDRVERRPVTLGLQGNSLVEVVAGVAEGEGVIRLSQGVEVGDRVRTQTGP